jgi:hypothetical protein
MNGSAMRSVKIASSSGEWRRFTPILIVECYLSFTVFVFAFGPWPWDVRNPVTLYTYLFLVQAALLLGYFSITTKGSGTTYTGRYSSSKLLKVSVALNLAAIIPFYYIQLGRFDLSASGMLSQIVAGATDPGKAYKEILNAPRFGSGSQFIVLWAYMLFTPILWLSVPLGVAAWESLSLKMKAAITFIVLANVATWIAIGTIQGIADNAGIIVISMLASRRKPFKRRLNLRRVAAIVCAISAVLFYFSYAQNSRLRGKTMVLTDKDAGITLDTGNILIAGLPSEMQSTVGRGSSYLSEGYYGLSLALEEPFQWSYGVGHSLFWIGVVQHVTGFNATNLTYPARVDAHSGWNMDKRWDSVYPWLASDVTFPGTLLLMFLIGRLLASVWIDTQSGKNPYALPLFVITMLIILYFPVSDKILTNTYSLGAFWGLLCLWLSTRRTIRRGRIGAWD